MTNPEPPGTDDAPSPSPRSLLDAVVAHAGGEHRAGQADMCDAVADALASGNHLMVEAPTGIGKSYAVATAITHWLHDQRLRNATGPNHAGSTNGEALQAESTHSTLGDTSPLPDNSDPPHGRVIVATATRALQDQLIDEDLPTVVATAADKGITVTTAVLKGRSNYLCLARAAQATGSLITEDRTLAGEMMVTADIADDGERSRLPAVDDATWRTLSVSADECPGARACSFGEQCWAEKARQRSAAADVVVVNTALYAAHLLSGGSVLVEHDAVVIDEAHALADIIIDAASVHVGAARIRSVERTIRPWGATEDTARLLRSADGIVDTLGNLEGDLDPTEGDLAVHLADARKAARDLARAATTAGDDEALQAASTATRLADDVDVLLGGDDVDRVVWTEGDGRLRCSPVQADELGRRLLWPERTVVCTSATLQAADATGKPGFGPVLSSLGAPRSVRTLAVASPFDHRHQGILYVPRGQIPDPRQPGWAEGVVEQLAVLANAAQGRTLALFTSRSATEKAASALAERLADSHSGIEVLTQWDAPRHRLVDALCRRRRVVICATRSFWTGIDIPGDACVVVAIDRVPFPRPDDPFLTVDVPAAAMQLAQGAGRLIRSGDDRGVVAVLDTRLATARWRHHILAALPPLRRSVDPTEVAELLAGA